VGAVSLPVDAEANSGGLVPLLVATGLASSNGDARRALEQGAVSVNGERVAPDRQVGSEDFLHGRYLLLRKGKRQYGVVLRGVDDPGVRR
jgi:tyrosyl-tRNA synthetase